MKAYSVSKPAHERGYGTNDEIVPIADKRVGARSAVSKRLLDPIYFQKRKLRNEPDR
jgi:hypothetical protein